MRKFILGIFLLIPAFIFTTSPTQALLITRENQVEIAQDEIIDDDVFAASDNVVIRGTINGDVYAVGGTVTIDGTINGDILAAGGTIVITGTVEEDIRAAGGNITISGTEIGDGVSIAGGNISIDSSSSIGGSLVAAGGSLVNQANVGRNVLAAGGNISLDGNVGGDAELGAANISLAPDIIIGGNLRYSEESQLEVPENASISGTIETFPSETFKAKDLDKIGVGAGEAATGLAALNLTFNIWSMLSALLVGFLTIYLFPRSSEAAADTLRNALPKSVLVGLASFFLAGPIFVMLMITLIGIPLAMILLAGYLIDLYFAQLVVGLGIGQALKKQFEWEKVNLYLALLLGMLVLFLLNLVPVLNFFVSLLTVFAGLGAMYIYAYNWYHSRK